MKSLDLETSQFWKEVLTITKEGTTDTKETGEINIMKIDIKFSYSAILRTATMAVTTLTTSETLLTSREIDSQKGDGSEVFN